MPLEESNQPTVGELDSLKAEVDAAWNTYRGLRLNFAELPTQSEIDALCAAYAAAIAKGEAFIAALKSGQTALGCNSA